MLIRALEMKKWVRLHSYQRHGSASILGTTRTDTRARILIRLVPNSLPTGKKAEIRPWIGLTNGA